MTSKEGLTGFLALVLLAGLAVGGCATYAPKPPATPEDLGSIQTKSVENVAVSVAILTDDQAKRHFGADLGSRGVQVLWMRVRNVSPFRLWFIRNIMDPDFFPADEAAYMIRKEVPKKDFDMVRQLFRDESMRVMIPPATVSQGFVFLPRKEGGRYIDIRLAKDSFELNTLPSPVDGGSSPAPASALPELRVGFALPLPDGDFDYERLDTAHTYAGMALPNLDTDGLRTRLEKLPCCATDAGGKNNGDPLNVVIVGEAPDVMTSLARSGWSFTHRITPGSVRRLIGASVGGKSYPVAPVSSLYLFGRKQDFALQRARHSIAQRNHMRLWLAPFLHEGRQVWVGQVSRDVGIKITSKSPTLTTHIIAPEVDLTREYLLHSLMAQGFVERFGFVKGAPVAPSAQPLHNLADDPYFTDGMRVVIVLSPEPVSYEKTRNLLWERSDAPIAEGQTMRANKNVFPADEGNDARP
jgi:hypothetical protein